MIEEVELLGIFIKTYSLKFPLTPLGRVIEFKKVIEQYSEFLNPKKWDYSNFVKYIPEDLVIKKSLLYDLWDLKIIHGYLVEYAHKEMDFLQKNPPSPLFPNYIGKLIEIEIEGKILEMDFFIPEMRKLWRLSKQIEHISEEIKSEGALGVLFCPKKPSRLKISE